MQDSEFISLGMYHKCTREIKLYLHVDKDVPLTYYTNLLFSWRAWINVYVNILSFFNEYKTLYLVFFLE